MSYPEEREKADAVETELCARSRALVAAIEATDEQREVAGQKLLVVWLGPDERERWPEVELWSLWLYSPTQTVTQLREGIMKLQLGDREPELNFWGMDSLAADLRPAVAAALVSLFEEIVKDVVTGRYDPGASDGALPVYLVWPEDCCASDDDDVERSCDDGEPRARVQDMINVHLIPELRWAHTHGLVAHGLPELEVRDVPPLFLSSAGALLNAVAEYMLENPPGHVKLGQTMELDRFTVVRFAKLAPIALDQACEYEVERWCLEAVEGALKCERCGDTIGSCADEHEGAGTGEDKPPEGGLLQ